MEISPLLQQVISSLLNKINLSSSGFLGFYRTDLDSKLSSFKSVYVLAVNLSSTWRMTMPSNSPSPSLYNRQGSTRNLHIQSFPRWCYMEVWYRWRPTPKFHMMASLPSVPSRSDAHYEWVPMYTSCLNDVVDCVYACLTCRLWQVGLPKDVTSDSINRSVSCCTVAAFVSIVSASLTPLFCGINGFLYLASFSVAFFETMNLDSKIHFSFAISITLTSSTVQFTMRPWTFSSPNFRTASTCWIQSCRPCISRFFGRSRELLHMWLWLHLRQQHSLRSI